MVQTIIQSVSLQTSGTDVQLVQNHLKRLKEFFEVDFSVVDAKSGSMVEAAPDMVPGDWFVRGEVCREVARREAAEVIEEIGNLRIVAVPIVGGKSIRHVAVAGFVTESFGVDNDTESMARSLLTTRAELEQWMAQQTVWCEEKMMSLANLIVERDVAVERARRLESHVDGLSENLSHTYEEISLLHRIASNLRISEGSAELTELALDWLFEIVAAEAMVAFFEPGRYDESSDHESATPRMLVEGACPLNEEEFRDLLGDVGVSASGQPAVLNRNITMHDPWRFPAIREVIVVPLVTGNKVVAYLAAFNHTEGRDFGTVEASLMSSVATMLAIHSGNIELYREQVDLLSGMVQALVSAIDAKDPYTCGHSDRVARVAVRLGEALDCDEETLNTIYLSGLLHDIGKIGVDDAILRKPGKLTDEEYEQVKQHPWLGYKILQDIQQIKDVLPGVLHHHEAWDGSGYPHGLAGHEIPVLARILAVADAFDAMGSDRSYRRGMPEEKLDSILREGAGQQWDAKVVDAFFFARDEIREIAHCERERIKFDLLRWG